MQRVAWFLAPLLVLSACGKDAAKESPDKKKARCNAAEKSVRDLTTKFVEEARRKSRTAFEGSDPSISFPRIVWARSDDRGLTDKEAGCLNQAKAAGELVKCFPDEPDFLEAFGPYLDCKHGTRRGPVSVKSEELGAANLDRYYCEKDGKAHGPDVVVSYLDDVVRRTFKDGVLDGPYQVTEGARGVMKDGKQEGLWSFYSALGGNRFLVFKNGQAHGPYRSHYQTGTVSVGPSLPGRMEVIIPEATEENGPIKQTGEFQLGKMSGSWTRYWRPDALGKERPKSRGKYKEGVPDGEWVLNWEDGSQAARGSFKDGKRQPGWKFWDEQKKPIDAKTANTKVHWLRSIEDPPNLEMLTVFQIEADDSEYR